MRYLLLHGFTGTAEGLAPLLAPSGSIAPTLGGHLLTPATDDFWAEVERLASLGRGCDALFGYSLGGRLALGILARYPNAFGRAVIVSGQPGLASETERAARRQADAVFVDVLRQQGLTAFVDLWQALPLWASQRSLPPPLQLEQRAQRLRNTAEGLAESLCRQGLAEMPDLRSLLPRVRCPVELLAGELDPKFVGLARQLAGIIPGARATIVPGAGHNLLLERPAACREALLERAQP